MTPHARRSHPLPLSYSTSGASGTASIHSTATITRPSNSAVHLLMSNRHRKTHLWCSVVGDWAGLCSANDRWPTRLEAFLRRTKRYGYCSENIATISDLFSAAQMNLCSSVSSKTNDTYFSRYCLLEPVSVTTYVLVTITDN